MPRLGAIRRPLLALSALLACASCSRAQRTPAQGAPVTVVLKHQPLWGDPAAFRALLDRFRRENPDVDLRAETLPNGSDVAREMFLTALEGGAQDFDVFAIDVIWTPEFARAGWLADLSEAFPPERLRRELLPGAAASVVLQGRTWAVPWYLDVGLLFYRTDLVPRAPRTYAELRAFAEEARRRDPSLAGFLWQGRQYEGLNCNVFEAIWGHGGSLEQDGRITLDTKEAGKALEFLRRLLVSGISPRSVTSAGEEESRRVFQDGHAVFLRNWPYVHALAEAEGSPVRGKVGVAPLPTESGVAGAGALGGWQLAVNAHAPAGRLRAATRLVAFLTSHEAAVELALRYSRIPARRAVYDDPRVRAGAPFIASLLAAASAARPRPVVAEYALAADAIQGELSAAVGGLRPFGEALLRAQRTIDRLETR
ncbi:MAG: ABC transporter substrate-binding protein [Myxococcales bacterium]